MSPRPFAFPLNIGTDICHIQRVRQIIQKSDRKPEHLQRFLRRFLSLQEQHDFNRRFQRRPTLPIFLDVASRHLAGRWAAKEAVIKAVTWRKLGFLDIHIGVSNEHGALGAVILDEQAPASMALRQAPSSDGDNEANRSPSVQAENTAANDAADFSPGIADSIENIAPYRQFGNLKGQIARISISHDGDYTTAVSLVADPDSK